MTLIKKLEKKAIKREVLALPAKEEVPTEVQDYKQKYQDFGINNSTIREITKKENKIETTRFEQKRKVIASQVLNLIIDSLFPYKIIRYSILNDIVKDYKLIMSSLSYYDRAIEEENIEELETLQALLSKKFDDFQRLGQAFPRGDKFSFDDTSAVGLGSLHFNNYFNIAAPLNHFNFRGDNVLKIGNEIKAFRERPKLIYNFKVNKMTLPFDDPIIYAPFFIDRDSVKELYCIIVTAWDKVADDSRIRTLFNI